MIGNLVQTLYLAEQHLASFSLLYIQLFALVVLHLADQQLRYLELQQQNVYGKTYTFVF